MSTCLLLLGFSLMTVGLDQVSPQLDIVPRGPYILLLMAWGRCSGTTILGVCSRGLI